jgi:hypothetical protein
MSDVISAALRLQQAATVEAAERILADVDSEFLRRRLRDQWDDLHHAQVVQIGAPRCLCAHRQDQHRPDKRGRNVCRGSVVCGCISFRLKESL